MKNRRIVYLEAKGEISNDMKAALIAAVLALMIQPIVARGAAWQEGKLVLSSSALENNYRTAKIALYMPDGRGATIWNYAGQFTPDDAPAGDCDICLIAQRTIDVLLGDCEQTLADFCQGQIPIHYRVGSCAAQVGRVVCLAIDFPLDPKKGGLSGRHKTLWIVAPIRPAQEVREDNRAMCIGSEGVGCRSLAGATP
jgi:hypothetical protein